MNLEPIRALLELAEKATPGPWHSHNGRIYADDGEQHLADFWQGDTGKQSAYGNAAFSRAARNSVPALSQLLEAVTNLEKLEAEWRAKQAVYLKAAKRNARRGNTELAHEHSMSASDVGGFADDLKRLLHPEDK